MFFRIIIAQVFFLSAVMGIFAQPSQEKIEVTTVLKEKFTDKNGNILTGKGVVIGDVDSGVDIFHPMFFFADGGDFKWLDVNSDGSLTFGTDGIDLNNNGSIESNEVLRYIEMRDNTWGLLAGADSKKYNPEYDFIYVDANGNKRRDYGPDKGFSETDPTYGEQLLISVDDNKNGKVDAGEKLVALKTSKVRAVRERDGKVRRRGVDLIYTEEDSSGHGTGVAGLILGGTYGVQKIQGLAPEAELVVSCIKYDYTPRFVRNFVDYLNFLKEEKVNILLIEDGEWMYEFMDGSSPEEQILNQMARDGVTIVGGAGNLTSGNMLIMDTLSAGKQASYKAEAPYITEGKPNDGVFFSFLWPNTNTNIEFTIETPEKNKVELSSGSGLVKSGSYNIYYAKETSPKGTVMFRFGCSKTDSSAINGTWKFTLNPDGEAFIRGYVVDVSQSWSGNSHWKDTPKITDESTVCFPSTADSCMAVGAYVVNFGWMDKVGDIASYSSKGFTITGKLGIDITGPGHSTITTEKDYSYQMFSGTSAAAPHVVGAAALLLQYQHGLTHTQIRKILLNSATQDNFTGPVPNPTWGYGKINIEEAIKFLINNSN